MSINDPLDSLKRFDQQEQMAILEAIDEKRRKENFVKYWQPQDQQKAHFPKFTKDIKIFGVLGGNRSGKTEEGAFITMAWALGKEFFVGEPAYEWIKDLPIPEPPCNIWVVGLDYGLLKNVIWQEKLRTGRVHPPLLPRDPKVITKVIDGEFQVYFANGSILTGKSADAGREKFQGASIDLAWIDEECESDVFDEIYQRTADCAGKILLTLTPLVDIASGVRTPWVYDLYEQMNQGRKDIEFVKLSVLENPYVPADEKEKLVNKWGGHFEESARLYGNFIQRSGLVYNLWNPTIHMVDPVKIPRDWRRIVSIDPAATGTTAAIWAAVEPGNNNLHLYREYYESNRIVSEHAKSMLLLNGGDPIDAWIIDPKWAAQRNNETAKTGLQLYRESGVSARPASINYEDYGLNAAREYISANLDKTARHPKVFVHRGLKNFKFEIEHYVWDSFAKGQMRGLSKDKPMKRDDHLMNAFQYLCCLRPAGRKTGAFLRDEQGKRQQATLNSYT